MTAVATLYGRLAIARTGPETGEQRRQVDLEDVRPDDRQGAGRGLSSQVALEPRRQVMVDFDGHEGRHAPDQAARQRSPARPDLQDQVVPVRPEGGEHPVDRSAVDQEVLPEAAAGPESGGRLLHPNLMRLLLLGGPAGSMV